MRVRQASALRTGALFLSFAAGELRTGRAGSTGSHTKQGRVAEWFKAHAWKV
jgi:hypothetical protein